MPFKAATHFASSTMVAWLKTSDEMTVIIKAFFCIWLCSLQSTAIQTNQFNPHNNPYGQAGLGLFSCFIERTECQSSRNQEGSWEEIAGTQVFPCMHPTDHSQLLFASNKGSKESQAQKEHALRISSGVWSGLILASESRLLHFQDFANSFLYSQY